MDAGWNLDGDCWNAGHQLLVRLMDLRTAQSAAADDAIRDYCLTLRRSDSSLALRRIQSDFHVPDYGIVLLIYGAASQWGVPPINFRVHEAVYLAVGFHPRCLIRAHSIIRNQVGFGRLLLRHGQYLGISREFHQRLGGSAFSDEDAARLKRRIAALPTVLDTDETAN